MVGDVNGDGVIDMLDAGEIFAYFGQVYSQIQSNTRSQKAAHVLGNSTLSIHDALEILKFLSGLDSAIEGDGNNPDRRPVVNAPTASIRIEIKPEQGRIFYIANTPLSDEWRSIQLTVSDNITIFPPEMNARLPGMSRISPIFNSFSGLVGAAVYICGIIPAETIIMTQKFEFTNLSDIDSIRFIGEGITEVTVNNCYSCNHTNQNSIRCISHQ
jgi:hypothetical protein